MPKNKVQFQKGLSLTQFLLDYGSEAQCEQALFDARWPDGLNCPRCGGARFCRLSTRRATFQCKHCKRQLSLLAGTVFQATKLPLSIWFLPSTSSPRPRAASRPWKAGRQRQHRLAAQAQAHAGHAGAGPALPAGGHGAAGRRLSGRRVPRRQARAGRRTRRRRSARRASRVKQDGFVAQAALRPGALRRLPLSGCEHKLTGGGKQATVGRTR